MKRDLIVRWLFRAVAIVIAIAGVIDPSVTTMRASRPEIAVVAGDRRQDSAMASRVARELQQTFTVIPADFVAASATVLVGDRLPGETSELSSPVFAVSSSTALPAVRFESVSSPASSPFDSRVPVSIVARVTAARGRTLDVTLRAGDLTTDHVSRTVASDDDRIPVTVGYLPTAIGAVPLRVTASLSGTTRVAESDVLANARDAQWSVLFYDPRPSWMSTFVRRAIERDRRFVVTSRVVTSRNISSDAGQPPVRLDDLAGMARFDAIVLGAPDALGASDVAGLETFLRQRGGSVVLLLDQVSAGPYERLTGVHSWTTANTGRVVSIARMNADSAGLRASEVAVPSAPIAGVTSLARTMHAQNSAPDRVAIWQTQIGAGQLVVNGALDAWRYRDRSDFDRFWQTLIAESASAAPPPVAVRVSGELTPNERGHVTVSLRDAALRSSLPARASVSAWIVAPESAQRTTIRLLPDGPVGEFRGDFRAPATPGIYRIVASGDGVAAEAPLVVAGDVARTAPDDRAMLSAWVGAHGGRAVNASRLGELSASLRAALRPVARAETWHPMRSSWWILLFAFALGGEWWLRRRRGLA